MKGAQLPGNSAFVTFSGMVSENVTRNQRPLKWDKVWSLLESQHVRYFSLVPSENNQPNLRYGANYG